MKLYHTLPDKKNFFRNPVVTVGNFDGVHAGHRKIFYMVKKTAEVTGGDPVVITFSSHPRKILNPEYPLHVITTTEEKINEIFSIGITNIILLHFNQRMADMRADVFFREVLIDKIDVRELVVGYDHAFGKNREGTYDFLKNLTTVYGIGITRVDGERFDDQPISSSWIRKEIEAGHMEIAHNLIGRPYRITGKVVRGDMRGRTLGFPTANISPIDMNKVVPGDGVYAVDVQIEDEGSFIGLCNIGNNPTFSISERRIEVYIVNFNQDIYDTDITISFKEKLRDEQTFPGIDELVKQMKIDREIVIGKYGNHQA